MNVSDDDAVKYIKIFTDLSKEEISELVAEQEKAPHMRSLQKRLAEEVTTMVHSREELEAAIEASGILFGNSTADALRKIDEQTLLQIFEGVPQFTISKEKLSQGIKAVDLFTEDSQVFPSKGEMRKIVQSGGVMINKEKLNSFDEIIDSNSLISNKYILAQRGKKNYFLLIVE